VFVVLGPSVVCSRVSVHHVRPSHFSARTSNTGSLCLVSVH